jgi:hypothetical protein
MGMMTCIKHLHVALVLAVVVPSPALGADRMTDRDVRALIDRIDEGRDQFDGLLGKHRSGDGVAPGVVD